MQSINNVADFLNVKTDGLVEVGEISNKSTELLKASKGMDYVINSSFYRKFIRPVVSDKLRTSFRAAMLPKVQIPKVKISESVELELKAKLLNIENEVEALIGKRIKINAIN